MSINKGKWNPETGYSYVCHNCNDVAPIDSKTGESLDCPYCYNGNWDKLVEQFATARGERYYALWKTMLRMRGKQWVDRFNEWKQANGKFLRIDLFKLFLETGLPRNRVKPFAEWLEETQCVYSGVYENMLDSGLKVGEALRIAEEEMR